MEKYKKTKKLYHFLKRPESLAKKLLSSLGLSYSTTPKEIPSLRRFLRRFRKGSSEEAKEISGEA